MEESRLKLLGLTVLVVEASAVDVDFIKSMLKFCFACSVNIVLANTLADAQDLLKTEKIDVVLLDFNLSDSYGLDTIQSIRAKTKAPIVVLANDNDESLALETLKAGAQDYLLKESLNSRRLSRSINYVLERHNAYIIERKRLHLLEQREDFIATLTHDLKNPLIGSNRIIELIVKGDIRISQEEQASLLLQVRDSNNGLLSMIQSLHEVYQYEKDMQVLHLERIDLVVLSIKTLKEVIKLLTKIVRR